MGPGQDEKEAFPSLSQVLPIKDEALSQTQQMSSSKKKSLSKKAITFVFTEQMVGRTARFEKKREILYSMLIFLLNFNTVPWVQ